MDSRIQFALMLDWVHVGGTCTKAVEYYIMSDRPIPPPQKKRNKTKQQQQKKQQQKHTHTHTNTSYGMVQNGRRWVDHVTVNRGTKTATQIRSRKRSGGNINNARITWMG